jgi:hypothetical protein
MKTGAQKWVTQRVRNRTGVVVARSVGDAPDMAPRWMKSRTWSRAMMIITAPRSASTENKRDIVAIMERAARIRT